MTSIKRIRPRPVPFLTNIPIDSGHPFQNAEKTAQFQLGIGAQFALESLPDFDWNECPVCLGIGMNSFLTFWLKNLKSQGHRLIESEES